MSLRDYFAGLAMRAMLSNPVTTENLRLLPAVELEKNISEAVYKMADAMMKAREQ